MSAVMVNVWDLPLRLSHWLLALVLVVSFVTGREGGLMLEWHARSGLLVMFIIMFRIAWGFVGSTYSRFGNFMPTPKRWRHFLLSNDFTPGHTPSGAISVLLLFAVTLVQVLTGLFSSEEDSEFAAPMAAIAGRVWSDRITEWHVQNVDVMMFLVAIHFAAICFYFFIRRKNLVLPMISGKVQVPGESDVQPVRGGGVIQLMLSLTVAALSVGLVFVLDETSLFSF